MTDMREEIIQCLLAATRGQSEGVTADAIVSLFTRTGGEVEPVAYAVFADNGNIRIWSADPIQTETLIQEYGDRVRPLYAAPQSAEQQPDVTLLLELLSHARCNTCDGSGGLYDNHGHPHQCQWCHDRSTALAAYIKGSQP